MSQVQVFVSFDVQHDEDLYALLLTESQTPSSGFAVLGRSSRSAAGSSASQSSYRQLSEADQMIVLCGEHTGTSTRVSDELEFARREKIPYILVWGRRELMCTKPNGARPADGMYSWTREILQDQIRATSRNAAADAAAEVVRAAHRKP